MKLIYEYRPRWPTSFFPRFGSGWDVEKVGLLEIRKFIRFLLNERSLVMRIRLPTRHFRAERVREKRRSFWCRRVTEVLFVYNYEKNHKMFFLLSTKKLLYVFFTRTLSRSILLNERGEKNRANLWEILAGSYRIELGVKIYVPLSTSLDDMRAKIHALISPSPLGD